MFGNKKSKTNNDDQEAAAKVNQDLVVRNMPTANRLNGTASTPLSATVSEQTESNSFSDFSEPKRNFKMIGSIIIVGGIIFIGVLVYLSYIYIIKPQANKKVEQPIVAPIVETNSIENLINEQRASSTEQIITATTSLVATLTPNVLDLATSSDSSIIMNEELTGKQNVSLPTLIDSDNDGLNDEEEIVLGTNPALVDSNNNTYADLVEINNNYNPVSQGKLDTNVNLANYHSQTFNYNILYPKIWTLGALNDDSTIIFTAPDDSIIQISVQSNTDEQGILDWYGKSFPDTIITYDKLKSMDNWDGVWGADNLNFYLTDKKHTNIYVISYIPAVDGRLVYPNIFNLMLNSLSIK